MALSIFLNMLAVAGGLVVIGLAILLLIVIFAVLVGYGRMSTQGKRTASK